MKTIVKIATITAVFFLSSCSTIQSALDTGAEINDEAIRAAEFTICNGASTGSIRRSYGTKEKAEAREVICTEYWYMPDKSFTPAEVSE